MTTASLDQSTLELLRFAALSACVHADALESHVDRVREAMSQMRAEDVALDELEKRLEVLTAKQKKIHALRDMVSASAKDRKLGEELLRQEEQKRLSRQKNVQSTKREAKTKSLPSSELKSKGERAAQASSPPPATTVTALDAKSAVRLACSAIVGEDGETNTARPASSDRGGDAAEAGGDETDVSIDDQVEQLKQRILVADAASVRSRLAHVEQLKQSVKSIDGDRIIAERVNRFKYGAHVEQLFNTGTVTESDLLASLADGMQRYIRRYQDALEVIALQVANPAAFSSPSEAPQLFSCLCYATELCRDDNADVLDVLQLEKHLRPCAPEVDPAEWEAALSPCLSGARAGVVCTSEPSRHCAGALERESVLSLYDYCALPTDWPSTEALVGSASEQCCVLPPARHMLTPRFSFSDLGEMRELIRARVGVQRRILQMAISGDELVEDVMVGCKVRERAVATARMAVGECNRDSAPFCWKTVLHIK